MNIGAGLSAANAFFKQNEHIQDRDYLAKQRAYQQQVMDTEAAGLSDASAAKTAANRLAAARANAGMETLPQETQNRMAGLGLESGDIAFRKAQQPAMQENARKATTVQGAGLDSAIAQIPEQEKARVAGNAGAANQRHQQALIELSSYLTSNDKAGALSHVNAVADAEALRTGTAGKKFVDIQAVGDGEDRAFALVAEDGSQIAIPYAAVLQAKQAGQSGKYKFFTDDKTGRVIAADERTGRVEEKIAADPQRMRALLDSGSGSDSDPADVKTAKWLKRTGIAQTDQQSWDMARSARAKSRAEWVGEMMKSAILPNSTSKEVTEIRQMLEEQYNALQKSSSPGLQSGSNTPSQFKVNPSYERLLK